MHIGDPLSAEQSAPRLLPWWMLQLNIEPSLAKVGEERPDEFAAGLIKDYATAPKASSASISANWIATALPMLSWNMQAYRSLDEFSSTATAKPSVFLDQGYSHPNLAWRVLRANHLIQGSPTTKALLDNFEEPRERAKNPKPLYKKPD